MTKEQEKIQVRIREYKKSLDMVEPVKAIVTFPSPYGDYDF